MSNKGGRVSPDYLADIAPEYAKKWKKFSVYGKKLYLFLRHFEYSYRVTIG